MEAEFLKWIQDVLPPQPDWPLGVTDDAALFQPAGATPLLFAADSLADGTHFVLEEVEPKRVGRKALAVNLSDLAAMAATPVAALVSLTLPRQDAGELARNLLLGMQELVAELQADHGSEMVCPIVGGDTNVWSGKLVVAVTVIGKPAVETTVWKRSGGRPGDLLCVTGELGGSIARKHFDFTPRLLEARRLAEAYSIHAAMDISDGLSTDGARLAAASGCGMILRADSIPISAAAKEQSRQSGKSPLEHALCDGEDFELLFSTDPQTAKRLADRQPFGDRSLPITIVGELTDQVGMLEIESNNQRQPLEVKGFEHR